MSTYVARPECVGCPLATSRYISGGGLYDTTYFVVGTAPGEEEERRGRVFAGQGGLLVRGIMQSVGLKPYYSNVLPRRPVASGKQRKPSRSECVRCGTHLVWELRRNNANAVLALGQVPFEFLTGIRGQSVLSMHGLEIPVKRFELEMKVMPAADVGYIMRSGGIHSPAGDAWLSDIEDFERLVRKSG